MQERVDSKPFLFRSVIMVSAILAACLSVSCSDADTGTTPPPGGDSDPGTPPLEGGVAEFDIGYALDEAYWYSRYNLGSLVMKGGLGETFMPDMTMVGQMITMVSDTDSTAMAPTNAALLSRVYNSGDPTWNVANDNDPMDFTDERWAAAIDTQSSGATVGWTMIKETQWARLFHVDNHFGAVGSTDPATQLPGAQQRFLGMVLYVEAVMQAQAWMMDGMNPSGNFTHTDLGGEYVMMAALSDLGDMTLDAPMDHSASNRYRMAAGMLGGAMTPATDADGLAGMFLMAADGLFSSLATPTTVRDLSLGTQALLWYARSANTTNRAAAKTKIGTFAGSLAAATKTSIIDHAYTVRGLLEAYRVTNDAAHLTAATDSFDAMLADFDWQYGVFTGKSQYTVDDVAVVLGALNSMVLNGQPADSDEAIAFIEYFFESVINMSGLQIAAPPVTTLPAYEQKVDDLFHRYPTIPMPRAGSTHRAPVLSSQVTWDGTSKTWSATTDFDTAGAMHLSNEMIWTHANEVNGFPVVP